jgi:hypothetical protein
MFTANSEEIVLQIRDQFDALLQLVCNTQTENTRTAYDVERALFRRLLDLGRRLLLLFFVCQAKNQRAAKVTHPDGQELAYHSQKRKSYLSVFGKINFHRSYYYQDKKGYFPLDAVLNLPKKGASDLLTQWRERLAVCDPYHKVGEILADILGQKLCFSTRELSDKIQEDAELAESFYAQAAPLPLPLNASILVVQADGKGVPMIKALPTEGKVRLGKGEKAAKKKEAIVTCVYTVAAWIRTPKQVCDSFFEKSPTPYASQRIAGPTNKRWWATLSGKEAALKFTLKQVASQEGAHITHRVALTDGSDPLQRQVKVQLPQFTLILDLVHASEYVWEAANAVLGESSPERTDWVYTRTLQMLSGQTQAVIDAFVKTAQSASCKARVRKVLLKVAGYFERNLAYMRYDEYLAAGFPIATGVIEGACRHLVKDRCELSGMRWTQTGAEGLLRLRSVSENGDFEAYHAYLRSERQRTLYGIVPAEVERGLPECTLLNEASHPSGSGAALRLAA